jgi:hypothetical protein
VPLPVEPDGGAGETPSTGDAEAEFVEPDEPDEPDEPAVDRIVPGPGEYCFTWTPQINRSVIIDGDLYTVSEAGVQVSDFETLTDVTWIRF